ncbi:MAG: hypothetical protein IT457_25315 [Planctomycetes bacterium]|nr:hypothetical protein [Planctomycetota bacterium]
MIDRWMSWEGGVDLCAATRSDLAMPNVLVHVARVVHTPLGSAPAGMVLYQPDPNGAPLVIGFVCTDPKIGAYFGPRIFAGTPFEGAPVHTAKIAITTDLPGAVGARVEVGGHVFETRLEGLGGLSVIDRAPGGMTPFRQQGLEAVAKRATLKVDGVAVALALPERGISGGAPAVWAPAGVYAR